MNDILKKINELLEYKESLKDSRILENKITDEILYLGYDISHKVKKIKKYLAFYLLLL